MLVGVDATDLDALTDALWTLTTDEPRRAVMGATAPARASQLSWQACARAALAALEDAAR